MDRKLTSILRIGLALILGACAAQHKPQELSEEKYFVTFAEGFTADSESENPRIGWRAYPFSTPFSVIRKRVKTTTNLTA